MKQRWIGGVLLLLLVYVGFASTWTVRQNEEGVRLRLGRAVGTVGAGLHLTLPYPIESIVRVPTTEVRVVPVGLTLEQEDTLSVRERESLAHWMTGDTNIVELRANVLYTVSDPVDYLYGFAAGDERTSHEDLMRAISETVLTSLVGSTTMDDALAVGKTALARRGGQEIQAMLDGFRAGIRLVGLNITEVSPPSRVIGAFNDVASAKSDRERRLAEAQGLLGTVLPSAQAEAREAVQTAHIHARTLTARAQGESESFRALAAEVARSPQDARERLWLDALARILGRTQERIVPAGSRVYVDS